jgi:uncharacterized protein (TIGR02300 family)
LVMIGGEELAQVAGWGQIVPHEGRFPVSSLSLPCLSRRFGFDRPCRSWQTAAPVHTGTNSPEELSVAKPEWGVKRACLACGTRFYDMAAQPIVCPKCETVFDPETIFKPRRARAEEAAAAAKAANDDAAKAKALLEEDAEDEIAALIDDVDDDDDDDAGLTPTDDDDDDDEVVIPIPKQDSDDN